MRIRLLKKSEIKLAAKIFVESYKKESKNRQWEEAYAEKYILMLYRLCKELCFVAIEEEKVVGLAFAINLPEFNKEILDFKVLLVHPDYRRKKIASKLMKRVLVKAENKYNIKEVEANIYTLTNFPITWYESIGFRTRKHYEVTRASVEQVLKII